MTKSSTLDRLLAIVLALLMMVSLMPVQAFADVEEAPVEEVTEQVVETPVEGVIETPVQEVPEVIEEIPTEPVLQIQAENVNGEKDGDPEPTSDPAISLDQTSVSLTVGQSVKLNATTANGTGDVAWTSSNEQVATVSDGTVTAVAAGDATITATYSGKNAVCTVTVNPEPALDPSITLDKSSVSLTVGQSVTLNATTANGTGDVAWTSSDEQVATVSAGTVTAVAAGEATITATYSGKTAVCTVTVTYPVAVTGITLDRTSAFFGTGETLQLNATVAPADATNKTVTWQSTDESIATVNENGLVTGVAAGFTTIVATTEDGGFTAVCAVSIEVALNEPTFPDSAFRTVVSGFDTDGNGYLSDAEIGRIREIACRDKLIYDYKGIEHLKALINFYCSGNKATSLDVSKNTALEKLHCNNNELASLVLGDNTSLKELICSANN